MPTFLELCHRGLLERDEEAYAVTYGAIVPMVYRVAFRITGREEAAEDVVQQTVHLLIERKLFSFESAAPLRTWMYRTAINLARRDQRFEARRRADSLDMCTVAQDRGKGPEDNALVEEERTLVRQALAELDPDDRVVLSLELEGLSNFEMADVLGISPGAARTRLSRARLRLRERVRRVYPGLLDDNPGRDEGTDRSSA